jgi:chaperone modulatory protein CbpM
VTLALVPFDRLDIDSFARATGLHPELVRRLVALGLLEVARDEAGNLWFQPGQIAAAYRLQRLRAGLSLNYASLGVVVDLLDRISSLEAELRNRPRLHGGQPWT